MSRTPVQGPQSLTPDGTQHAHGRASCQHPGSRMLPPHVHNFRLSSLQVKFAPRAGSSGTGTMVRPPRATTAPRSSHAWFPTSWGLPGSPARCGEAPAGMPATCCRRTQVPAHPPHPPPTCLHFKACHCKPCDWPALLIPLLSPPGLLLLHPGAPQDAASLCGQGLRPKGPA